METVQVRNPEEVTQRGADIIRSSAAESIALRGRFCLALSGGSTPWAMLRQLAQPAIERKTEVENSIDWRRVHLFQVDERVAPDGHSDRNLTRLLDTISGTALEAAIIHPMPVTAPDLITAAQDYESLLASHAGSPAVLDLVHLGLGSDGHTASLVPDDPVLDRTDCDVALAGPYQGRRRMTLTYRAINRARQILWLVTGDKKSSALEQWCAGNPKIPAVKVETRNAILVTDCRAISLPESRLK